MYRNRAAACLCSPAFVLLAVSLHYGCKREKVYDPAYPASGKVTFDDKPLESGAINFITSETGDLQSIPIQNGRYEGQVRPGKRRVEIQAYHAKPRSGPMDPPPVNYLPAAYNSNSTLSAEVTAAGPNIFDFNLKSK